MLKTMLQAMDPRRTFTIYQRTVLSLEVTAKEGSEPDLISGGTSIMIKRPSFTARQVTVAKERTVLTTGRVVQKTSAMVQSAQNA